jgi:tRNA pseudouridine13 synthase
MLAITRARGTGGGFRSSPEDFVVKEITANGTVLEPGAACTGERLGRYREGGKHIEFVLEKRNWNTLDAVIAIAKRLGRGRKSVGYAGTKDRNAITLQLASVFSPGDADLSSFSIKDIRINGQWRGDGISMGDVLGNAFEITVRDAEGAERAAAVADELGGLMPNYFGEQRFGYRGNNARIGAAILRGDFGGAVDDYLTYTGNETNEEASEARRRYADERDPLRALSYFPRFLKGERTVLAHLAKHDGNYANALRLLPRGTLLMFVHAVQSSIFNSELEARVGNGDFTSAVFAGEDFYGFPDMGRVAGSGKFALGVLPGFESREEELGTYAKEAMERMQIGKEQFAMRQMPELSMKGAYRPLLAPVKGLGCSVLGSGAYRLSFSLPSGSYATALLNEFIKGPGAQGQAVD